MDGQVFVIEKDQGEGGGHRLALIVQSGLLGGDERLRFIEACAWWKGIVQRQAVERDFAMTGGTLKIKVRKAMEGYLRDRLGLTMADGKMPVKLLEIC